MATAVPGPHNVGAVRVALYLGLNHVSPAMHASPLTQLHRATPYRAASASSTRSAAPVEQPPPLGPAVKVASVGWPPAAGPPSRAPPSRTIGRTGPGLW